jgi:porin
MWLMSGGVSAGNITGVIPLQDAASHWNVWQDRFTARGMILETVNTIDVLSPVSGGLRQQTAVAGDLDLLLTIDGEKSLGWDNSTFFIYGLGLYGENPSRNIGDAQAVSSLAAPNTWKLFEAWYQQNFFNDRISILAGLYDVTSEFDVIRSSSELFLNSSLGTGPEFASSGKNGPSTFPATSLSIRGQAILNDSIAVRAVIADGVSGDPKNSSGTQIILKSEDGLFLATEVAYHTFPKRRAKGDRKELLSKRRFRLGFSRVGRAAPMEYQGKYALGLWGYTTEIFDLSGVDGTGNPVRRDGTFGVYALAEQMVFHETEDPSQGVTVFARVGFADPRVNRFSQYYGGGLVYRGLIPGRPEDESGFGVAAAVNGSHFQRGQQQAGVQVADAEVSLEMTHAINVTPEILLQPNIQYVMNPGTNPAVQNAFVFGFRLGVNINWFDRSDDSMSSQ